MLNAICQRVATLGRWLPGAVRTLKITCCGACHDHTVVLSRPLQPRPRDKVIAHIMNYVHTDAACCLYERGTLARRQQEVGASRNMLIGPHSSRNRAT